MTATSNAAAFASLAITATATAAAAPTTAAATAAAASRFVGILIVWQLLQTLYDRFSYSTNRSLDAPPEPL